MNVIAILLDRMRRVASNFIRLLLQLPIALVVVVATFGTANFARRLAARLLARTELRDTIYPIALR